MGQMPGWRADIYERRAQFFRENRMRELMRKQSFWAEFVWERRVRNGKWK